ncbi:MAG: MgtC/SapB family protein [Planctomycetes bacterium]|nr:MgtC/SapB family protein [Planctomycetota bacterium]
MDFTQDLVPLLFALLLGGAVGLEREYHGRPAGLRTHILVCMSSTMLILISRELGTEAVDGAARATFDPNRMGAGIVTGIGFLGASTVLRSGDFLRGLTTAACIWFVAGLGIVLGAEHYALGILCTAIVLLVLTVLNSLAGGITPTVYRRLIVILRRPEIEPLVAEIKRILAAERISVMDVASGHDNEHGTQEIVLYLSLRNEGQAPRVTERVSRLAGVTQARWKSIAS